MPVPQGQSGSFGNLIAPQSLGAGKNVAIAYNALQILETDVFCDLVTGSTAPTKPTTFACYAAYGGAAPITLTAAVAAGATTLPVSATAGLTVGRLVAIIPPGGVGELATTSAVTPGSSVTLAAGLQSAYAAGAVVWISSQTPYPQIQPGEPAGGWSPSRSYSPAPMMIGDGLWVIGVTNADQAVTVAVAVSSNWTTGFA